MPLNNSPTMNSFETLLLEKPLFTIFIYVENKNHPYLASIIILTSMICSTALNNSSTTLTLENFKLLLASNGTLIIYPLRVAAIRCGKESKK